MDFFWDTYETDPIIAEVEAQFARTDRLIPNFKTMHPLGELLPQECVLMIAHDFVSVLFQTIAREWAPYIAMALERSVKARGNGITNPGQVIDIHFGDFMADTFGTIQKIYDYFGMEFAAEAETRMRQFLAENPEDKHGKHTYRFSETGLDLDEERNRVRHYQEYFGVQSEGIS
ncbi:MAG: hypothetical protein HOC20_12655 [Chloroflexi bacterium]|jgi:hypothetical protein|nr:hypothetical protein [Chloroflexota bacterium]